MSTDKIVVCCGTYRADSFTLDIHDPDAAYAGGVKSLAWEKDEALETLRHELSAGKKFAAAGNRNNQAVNTCIALHVLGYNPIIWFKNFFKEEKDRFYSNDIESFMEHVGRVCDYLDTWGPVGNEGDALQYCI